MTKETGTLAALNVKPGDVVECVGWSEDDSNLFLGQQYTIMGKHPKGYCNDLCAVREGHGWARVYQEDDTMLFRLVSRASATPKTWGEMTDAEKGALLLADCCGEVVEWRDPHNTNYDWDTDKLRFGVQYMAYRVRPPEPKRETVTLYGGVRNTWAFDYCSARSTHRITFDVIDGKPDCASIRMEEL